MKRIYHEVRMLEKDRFLTVSAYLGEPRDEGDSEGLGLIQVKVRAYSVEDRGNITVEDHWWTTPSARDFSLIRQAILRMDEKYEDLADEQAERELKAVSA